MSLPIKPTRVMLSIDAGKNNLGWAVWDWTVEHRKKLEPPLDAGSLDIPNGLAQKTKPDEWEPRIQWLLDKMKDLTDYFVDWDTQPKNGDYPSNRLAHIAVECAEFRAGDEVGHAAAARGDLGALYVCAGAVLGLAWEARATGQLVFVSEWKRQLDKLNVATRINRAVGFGSVYGGQFQQHAFDAVGVGLYSKGFDIDDEKVFGRPKAYTVAKKKKASKKK